MKKLDTPPQENKIMDDRGRLTLSILSSANKFNKWVYNTIKPFIHGEILEIGSGIGNITQCFIEDNCHLTASDIDENYCDILSRRFENNPYLKKVRRIDIVHPDFDNIYADLFGRFDCVVAINMVEHVKNDLLAVENCNKLLCDNGHLIILVPAYPSLYNRFDKELDHFRRYKKNDLQKLLSAANFGVNKTQYFNFVGILGWWISGSILHRKNIPEYQMDFFDFLTPLIKLIDKIICQKVGLSLISYGIKK